MQIAGFWDGYYLGKKLGEWTHGYGSLATKRKIYIGKVMNYFSKIGVAEIKLETHDLQIDDEIQIEGPTTGVLEDTVTEIRVDDQSVLKANKGESCSLATKSIVRRMDKVYKVVNVKPSND